MSSSKLALSPSPQIRWGEGDKLEALFTRTREIRRGIVAAGQESAEPNFGQPHRTPPAWAALMGVDRR